MRAWVPQYHDTADITAGTGETFNQNLVAMTAGDWARLTGYLEVSRDLESLVQKYWLEFLCLSSERDWSLNLNF